MNPSEGAYYQDHIYALAAGEIGQQSPAGSPLQGRLAGRSVSPRAEEENVNSELFSQTLNLSSDNSSRNDLRSSGGRDADNSGFMLGSPLARSSGIEDSRAIGSYQERSVLIARQIEHAENLDQILNICMRLIDQFTPGDIAKACARLAELRVDNEGRWVRLTQDTEMFFEEILDKLAERTINNALEFDTDSISTTAFAFATLSRHEEALFAVLAREAIAKIENFNPETLSRTAWAFSNFRPPKQELYNAIREKAVPRIREFNPKQLADMAWAFAWAGAEYEDFFSAVARAVISKIRDCRAQDVANVIRAFGIVGINDRVLFSALARQAVLKIRDFTPRMISYVAWVFSIMQPEERERLDASAVEALYDALAKAFNRKFRLFSAGEFHDTAEAFRNLGIANQYTNFPIAYRQGNITTLQTPSLEK